MVVQSEGAMGYDFRGHQTGVLELQFDFEMERGVSSVQTSLSAVLARTS